MSERNQFSKHTQRDVNFFKWRICTPYIAHRTRRLYDPILRARPEIVLDVGCGQGTSLQYIRPLRYVGLDSSLARLNFASIHNNIHAFIQGDGTRLPFCSGQFDLVFCKGTLHHLSKQGVFLMLREMTRVCKKGGWVVIIEPNACNPSFFLLALIRRLERRILNCKAKTLLRYFEQLGMGHEIQLKYDGTFSPLLVLTYFFRNKNFLKTKWFMRLWEKTDYFINTIVPERFWTNIVITARKVSNDF